MKKQLNILFLMDHYNYEVHHGISQVAHDNNWHLNSFQYADHCPYGWQGDGAIICTSKSSIQFKFAQTLKCPIVYIDLYNEIEKGYRVRTDCTAHGKVAAKFFLEKGYSNFAFYGPSQGRSKTTELFYQGYIEKLKTKGYNDIIRFSPRRIKKWDLLQARLLKQLSRLQKPTAIYTVEDSWAMDLIDAAQNANLAIPEQLAVLGNGNNKLECNSVSIPISSIDSNFYEVGVVAAKLIEKVQKDKNIDTAPILISPKTEIAERNSTDVIAVKHLGIAKALRFIAHNFHKPINVDDVAEVAGVSRAGLHKAFKKHINRPPGHEIIRQRFNHAKKLLRETNYKVNEVAVMSGFTNSWPLYELFKKELKTSPRQYRLKNKKENAAD